MSEAKLTPRYDSQVEIDAQKQLLFERIFEIIKIGLFTSLLSHFVLEILGSVWHVNNTTSYINTYYSSQSFSSQAH